MKPTAEEIIEALGNLAACFAIPGSSDKHYVKITKPPIEAERAYLSALDVLTRYHHA